MRKTVKGGIEKHYCDKCGKSIFDYIPKEPTVQLMGEWIPEFKIKKHSDYKIVSVPYGEYCLGCYGAKTASTTERATVKGRRRERI